MSQQRAQCAQQAVCARRAQASVLQTKHHHSFPPHSCVHPSHSCTAGSCCTHDETAASACAPDLKAHVRKRERAVDLTMMVMLSCSHLIAQSLMQ